MDTKRIENISRALADETRLRIFEAIAAPSSANRDGVGNVLVQPCHWNRRRERIHQPQAGSPVKWNPAARGSGAGSHFSIRRARGTKNTPAAIALRALPRDHWNPVAGKSAYLPAVRRLNL